MPRKRRRKVRVNERELRRLLLSDQPEDAEALAKWEKEKTPRKAAKPYAAVAATAGEEIPGAWQSILSCGSLTLMMGVLYSFASPDDVVRSALAVGVVNVGGATLLVLRARQREKAARAAARWLLEHGERRCLTPIARLWNPYRREEWMTEGKDHVFAAILSSVAAPLAPGEREALQGLLYRAYPYQPPSDTRDFTDAETEILCGAMGCLARSFDAAATRAITRLARYPVPENAPNRRFVCDIARAFLGEDKPVILPAPSLTATLPAEESPSSLFLRRSK